MSEVVPLVPKGNGDGPLRSFCVHYVVQIAGQPQQHVGATVKLAGPPSTPEEIQALAKQMANQIQVRGRDEKSGGVLVGTTPPVTVMVLGWQELGK